MVHVGVLVLVLTPTIAIIFPGVVILLAATLLTNVLAADSTVAGWIEHAKASPLVVACFATLAVAAWTAARIWLERDRTVRSQLRDPAGKAGEDLKTIVADQWKQLSGDASPCPFVRWFPALDIAAYAVERRAQPEVHVSAGLWRALIEGQRPARAILAHELAHVLHKDARLLRCIEAIARATSVVTLFAGAIALMTLGALLVHIGVDAWMAGQTLTAVLFRALQTLGAAAVILIILPLGWFAIRRQVAFITSLVEVRADVCAAEWTEGLERYTQAFAETERMVASTRVDLLVAMLSSRLTHIPQRERLELLRRAELIVTPKLRFFALSVLLAFLLPINFATPYLFHGALNYVSILSLAVVLNVAIVAMLINGRSPGQQPVALRASRYLTVSLASCLVAALPKINLEPLSYLFMSWVAGFGGEPLSWPQLTHDLGITLGDVGKRVRAAVFNLGFLPAVGLASVGLFLLARGHASCIREGSTGAVVFPALVAAVLTVLAGLESRFPLSSDGMDELRDLLSSLGWGQTILLGLPLLGAALADRVVQLSRSV